MQDGRLTERKYEGMKVCMEWPDWSQEGKAVA